MCRALPSLGMFAGMAPSLVAPMEIATLALSTSENVQTGHLPFLHLKMSKSQYNLHHESCSVAQKPFKFLLVDRQIWREAIPAHIPQLTSVVAIGRNLFVNFPQKGGSEPWQVCRDGSFPRCPFGSRTICPFRIRKCADRLANF